MRAKTSEYALLGMLSIEPMTGYEIKPSIEQSIAHFWSESYGQIYPTLKRLAGEGSIVGSSTKTGRRAESCVYRLTDAGRRRLREWLAQPTEPQLPRNPLLLKIFFGRSMSRVALRRHVDAWRRRQEQTLALLSDIQDRIRADAKHPDAPFWQLALNHGVQRARAEIKWCDESLRTIDAHPKPRARK